MDKFDFCLQKYVFLSVNAYFCVRLFSNKQMNMQYFRTFLFILTFFLATVAVCQTRIRTVHETQKGETLNSLSQQYGVSVEALVSVNPEISSQPDKKIKRGFLINIPEGKNAVVAECDTLCIAVVLPFTAEGKEGSRSVEYYRGLLMAADKERESGRSLKFVAIDEPGVKAGVAEVIEQLTSTSPNVIVGPLYPTHFQAIATFANAYRVKNVIPFSSKVKQVETNPYIYLINTPVDLVQSNSFELFHSKFRGSRVVVVRTTDASESNLVNSWMDNMLKDAYEVQTLPEAFTSAELQQAMSRDKRNVVVIDGSNQQVVLGVVQKLYDFQKANANYRISVVGHSAWQQFSMEYSELLSTLDTYVLTPDFYNAYSKQVIDFEDKYFSSFKEYPLLLHPRMGELGYDTGVFLFNCNEKNTLLDQQGRPIDYLQTKLNFKRLGNGGYVNTSLMFIHYTPDHKVELIELKK